jgi:hypothetical protein
MTEKQRAKPKEKYVMVCPKCKSPDISIDRSNPLQGSMGLPSMYVCNKCDHTGYSFPEVEISGLEEFEKEVRSENLIDESKDKTPLVDVNYGKFMVTIFWKISSISMLFLGIYYLPKLPIVGVLNLIIGMFMFYFAYLKKHK